MKNFATVFGAFITLFIISCEGPEGPPGFEGPEGVPGIQGQVFEVDNVNLDFDAGANLFSSILTFDDFFGDDQFEVLPQDAVLVYRFDGTVDFQDGSSEDAWSLIPQSFFLPEGTIQYTSAHTSKDVQIFIDGSFDIANISVDFIDNQLFRIVFIPNEALQVSRLDTSNMEAVLSFLGMDETAIKRVN